MILMMALRHEDRTSISQKIDSSVVSESVENILIVDKDEIHAIIKRRGDSKIRHAV